MPRVLPSAVRCAVVESILAGDSDSCISQKHGVAKSSVRYIRLSVEDENKKKRREEEAELRRFAMWMLSAPYRLGIVQSKLIK